MSEWPIGIVDDGDAVPDREPRFDQPPASTARERRAHARAYRYWDNLRADRRLPAIAEVDPEKLRSFASHSVLFDLEAAPDAPAVRFIGAALAQEAGAATDLPERIAIQPGTLLGELRCRLPLIAATGAPLDFEAEFLGQEQMPTLYRGVLLPFAGDGGRPTFIYGVVTWKTIAAEIDDDICSAIGSALSIPFTPQAQSPWDERQPKDQIELPKRSFAQRLAAAQTWAALAAADHAHRTSSLHAALSAAHDFLIAEEEAIGAGTDEAEAAAVVSLVFGPALTGAETSRYRAVLDQARQLRLGTGTLVGMLDRYEAGVDGFLAARPARPEAMPDLPSLRLATLDAEALATILAGRKPLAEPVAQARAAG